MSLNKVRFDRIATAHFVVLENHCLFCLKPFFVLLLDWPNQNSIWWSKKCTVRFEWVFTLRRRMKQPMWNSPAWKRPFLYNTTGFFGSSIPIGYFRKFSDKFWPIPVGKHRKSIGICWKNPTVFRLEYCFRSQWFPVSSCGILGSFPLLSWRIRWDPVTRMIVLGTLYQTFLFLYFIGFVIGRSSFFSFFAR